MKHKKLINNIIIIICLYLVGFLCAYIMACATWELKHKKDFKSPFDENYVPKIQRPKHWSHPDYK